jgi:hypothetical protein
MVEYLKEFSRDLTSEVTTEIREAAEFISPDNFTIRNDKKAQTLF